MFSPVSAAHVSTVAINWQSGCASRPHGTLMAINGCATPKFT